MEETENSRTVLYGRLIRRINALLVDAVVYTLAIVAALGLLALFPSTLAGKSILIALFAFVLLYEPILVSKRGATLGQRAVNLRVVPDGDREYLSLFSALLRTGAKALLGFPSFFFMALTKRHQAFHDLISASTVQISDPDHAKPGDYVRERTHAIGAHKVSAFRRLLIVLLYSVLGSALLFFGTAFFVSDVCLLYNECTENDDLIIYLVSLAWILMCGLLLIAGWRGKLLGARAEGNAES